MEFFRFLVDRLRELGALDDVRVFGGGGGTITPEEAAALHDYGVDADLRARRTAAALGLDGMIQTHCSRPAARRPDVQAPARRSRVCRRSSRVAVARLISWLEDAGEGRCRRRRRGGRYAGELASARERPAHRPRSWASRAPAARASRAWSTSWCGRFRLDFPERSVGLLLVDPSAAPFGRGAAGRPHPHEHRSHGPQHIRPITGHPSGPSLALSRDSGTMPSRVLRADGFDLVIVETAGIGQSDSEIVDLVADCLDLRHDARLRSPLAAREDRHARTGGR